MARARPESGTRCSRLAFIRPAEITQVRASGSISSQAARRTSPERAAVRTRNSRDSLVTGKAPELRTAPITAGTYV